MNVIAIIPARMDASRFPGKPMKEIIGVPMIGHCFFRTALVESINDVYVATCDLEIFNYIESIGGKAIMTSSSHTRASTRTAEAMEIIEQNTGKKVDIVVMVQGDEPLITPNVISKTLPPFADSKVNIVNIMSKIKDMEQFIDKNNVKVVCDNQSNALYFSRESIPSPWKGNRINNCYMQTGIIAFRRDALVQFNSSRETPLENVESIDMNRVIENGGNVRMIPTNLFTLGVDTQEELKIAEDIMKADDSVNKYFDNFN